MMIELFYDKLGFVTGFRHSWAKSPKNKPIQENVRIINDGDYDDLVRFLAHLGIQECDENKAHFKAGNLYLKALDYKSRQALESPNYRNSLQVSKY